jgi:hypothetical protein
MGLLTFLFPAWRAAEAAETAAAALAKREQTERIKAMVALQQTKLDSETQTQVQEVLSQELASQQEQSRRVLAIEASRVRQQNWERKNGWWILVVLVFLFILVSLLSH